MKQTPFPAFIRHRPDQRIAPDPAMEGRVGALEGLRVIQREMEAGVLKLEAARGGIPICAEGCGRCCQTNVPKATGLEAHAAVSTMAATEKVLQRAREWLTEPDERLTVYPEATPRVLGGAPNTAFPAERMQQALREAALVESSGCPFLDEDKRCMVHNGRPLSCRAYGLTYAPDAFCERPLSQREQLHPGSFEFDNGLGEGVRAGADLLHDHAQKHDRMAKASGFFPLVLLSVADPEGLQKLVESGQVPMAKLLMLSPNSPYPGTLTQREREHMAALQQRTPPDEARPNAITAVVAAEE